MNIVPYIPDPSFSGYTRPDHLGAIQPVGPARNAKEDREDASARSEHFVSDVEEREKILDAYHVPESKAGLFAAHDEQTRKALDAYQSVAGQEEQRYLDSVFNLDVFA